MNNDNWIDIIPPSPPADEISIWPWLVISLSVALLLAVYLWHNSARQKSLRSLNKIQLQLSKKNNLNGIPFEISNIIKQRFAVNNIHHIKMPEENRWLQYKQRVTAGCFDHNKPLPAELDDLLSETRYWVKQPVMKSD